MAQRVVIANRILPAVRILDRSIPDVVAFDPPIPQGSGPGLIDQGGYAIWGDDQGRLITTCQRGPAAGIYFWHFDGGVWTEHTLSTPGHAVEIFGTSYNNVWALFLFQGVIWHFDGTSWVQDTSGLTPTPLGISCDPTGTEVWAISGGSGADIWRRTGGAYGSGVWVSMKAQLLSDTGFTLWGAQWIEVVSSTEVYFSTNVGIYGQYVMKWNGSAFSQVGGPGYGGPTAQYGSTSSRKAGTPQKIWYLNGDPNQIGNQHVMCWIDGTGTTQQTANGVVARGGADLIMVSPTLGYAVGNKVYAGDNDLLVWETTDGATWANILEKTDIGTANEFGVGLWEQPDVDAPLIVNVSPVSETEDVGRGSPIQFDAIDTGSGVNVSATEVLVNGAVVWTADAPAVGYSGSRQAITNGWRYRITKDGGWAAGAYFGVDLYIEDAWSNPASDSIWFVTTYESVIGRMWLRTIARKMIRITFNRDVIVEDALDKTKYAVELISNTGQQIAIRGVQGSDPDGNGETRYVDILLTSPTLGSVYKITASSMRTVDGKIIESAEGYIRGRLTKTDSILDKLTKMYDVDLENSVLAHVLIGVGSSDDIIGAGENDFDVIALTETGVTSSTFGTATFGTNTFGG